MKAVLTFRVVGLMVSMLTLAFAAVASAQSAGACTEISNDVNTAVSKDPSKVLMVVEDALVINEGCAADIVKAAIIASKADPALAAQIVQTAVSVAPKMAAVINEAAGSVVPGLAAVAPVDDTVVRPISVADKNPGKNPVVPPAPEDDFFAPSVIHAVFLIQPPASGPLPLSPSFATP